MGASMPAMISLCLRGATVPRGIRIVVSHRVMYDTRDMGTTSLKLNELHAVAMAAVRETASPSAQSNLVEEVAALAMEQYLAALAGGVEIDNPFGWFEWQRAAVRSMPCDGGAETSAATC